VDNISFEVAAGELFGLLGPNGAGKTTKIKMPITLLTPTAG
jgi:ABC-2 type transport system ATP-binding protein